MKPPKEVDTIERGVLSSSVQYQQTLYQELYQELYQTMSLVYRWPRLYAWYDVLQEIFINILCYWGIRKRLEPDGSIRLDGQTVIVTGGNRGFGAGITRDLVSRGARVIIACRDIGTATGLVDDIKSKNPSASITVMKLDLSSFASTKQFANDVLNQESRIDVLINNSGAITKGKVLMTDDGCEQVLQVNYLSHVLLTSLLLERMKSSSSDPRIVFVSSLAHHRQVQVDLKKVPAKDMLCYSLSKIAIMMFVKRMAAKWPQFPIRVYAVDPGMSATGIAKEMSGKGRSWLLESFLIQQLLRPPREGSNSILFPVMWNKSTYHQDQWYSQDGLVKKPAKVILDQNLVDKVWRQTFQIIDVPEIVF